MSIFDIPLLVDHFNKMICSEYGIPAKGFHKDAMKALQSVHWTGNIRELRNVIERLIILSGEEISKNDVQLYVKKASPQRVTR